MYSTFSKGTPEIPKEVYQRMYDQWQADLVSTTGCSYATISQGVIPESKIEKLKKGELLRWFTNRVLS